MARLVIIAALLAAAAAGSAVKNVHYTCPATYKDCGECPTDAVTALEPCLAVATPQRRRQARGKEFPHPAVRLPPREAPTIASPPPAPHTERGRARVPHN